jgi:5,10-methylenetetrahydromethanopterin reductase
MELWTVGAGIPGLAAPTAVAAEQAGWDGLAIVDSQNLSGDVYVALALAAKATDRLQLATGVTNPFTRHPAVTAAAIATVQGESGGRAVLGIGRGDSSLAFVGLAPATVPAFERYLSQVQRYLAGEAVPFEEFEEVRHLSDPPPISELDLATAPVESRLEWLRWAGPKVPVDVAATGPRVIDVAARYAERVTFAVGADPERVSWAIGTARDARERAGLPGDSGWSPGAFVNVVVDPDRDTAKQLIAGGLASFARFSVMHGRPTGPVDDGGRDVLLGVHRSYDMTRHTRTGAAQTGALTDPFIDTFGIAGDAGYCIKRLGALIDLGLDRLIVVGPSIGADREAAAAARARFERDVLPALRD